MTDDPNSLLAPDGRETKIRRDARGRWFNDVVPITHEHLVRAFDSWVDLADDGRYCLRNAVNWAYVDIDGAPVFVRAVAVHPEGAVLTLSDGRVERLDARTLRQGPDGALYCTVRGGRLTARFDQPTAIALEAVVGEDDEGIYLDVANERVRPPMVDDPLRYGGTT
jgi:hypothetical protein